MKTPPRLNLVAGLGLLAVTLAAQDVPPPAVAPAPAAPPVAQPAAPVSAVAPAQVPGIPTVPRPAAIPGAEPANPEATIKLNFKNTPIEAILQYLSESAGFIIVTVAKVEGNITAFSHQPLTKDEAVDLLNTLLISKGFAAVRSGRTLTIVNRDDAKKRLIPVISGADPEGIPAKDEIVTQIMPVKYVSAQQLVQNLTPLLDEHATLSANESSNSLILTDTQSNIRRMAQIIQALDTSIAGISTMRVYQMRHAKAADVANIVNQLYGTSSSSSRGGGSGGSSDGSPNIGDIMERMRSRMSGGR